MTADDSARVAASAFTLPATPIHVGHRGLTVDGVHLPTWLAAEPILIETDEQGLTAVRVTLLTNGPVTVEEADDLYVMDLPGGKRFIHPPGTNSAEFADARDALLACSEASAGRVEGRISAAFDALKSAATAAKQTERPRRVAICAAYYNVAALRASIKGWSPGGWFYATADRLRGWSGEVLCLPGCENRHDAEAVHDQIRIIRSRYGPADAEPPTT